MYKFKGTINGVEYTNRKDFFEALRNTKNNGKYNVTLSEVRNDGALREAPACVERKEVAPANENQYKPYEQLSNALVGLFTSFLKAQNPALYNKLLAEVNKNDTKKDLSKVPANTQAFAHVQKQADASEFSAVLTKYFFKDTTYVFTGGAEDEFHLDRFAGLLQSRAKEIENEDFKLSKAQKRVLYNRALSEFSRMQKAISDIEDSLMVTDRQLAGLEKVISSYKEISYPVPSDINESYNNQKHAFDILTNRKHYHELLADHYRYIGPYFDPEQ